MPNPAHTGKWSQVAATIQRRMIELGLKEPHLAARSRVSLTIVRELAHNTHQRDRHPLTLSRLSQALGLKLDHLQELASRPAIEPNDELLAELAQVDLPPAARDLVVGVFAGLTAALHDLRAEYTTLKRDVEAALESAPAARQQLNPVDASTR
ncbi:hypothetical protein Aglo03_08390 [Actinokineospora globicatena]|uniref:Uncharacterized protein n=2 Tax=Actinokineospora globicatena TaxID=103729 RepID=A0A9W6QGI7_9PSEU|nr:hypothetical protein Aglo03_08390 [Actinokineospora globicatena]